MNELFDRLGHSDVTFVDATDVIAAWIGTRAQDVLAALDSKDFDTVERMIREAGQEAKGLRKNVAENWYALTELKAEFVAVSGAI
jgi:hypothetical protein